MVDSRVTAGSGSQIAVEEAAVDEFKASIRGQVLRSGDEGYDDARKVWNGMIDRRPGLIARCAGAADVINSVNFARANNLLVAVRGGGHSFPGHSTCDGGLVIDLSTIKSVRVDPAGRTARAEPGARGLRLAAGLGLVLGIWAGASAALAHVSHPPVSLVANGDKTYSSTNSPGWGWLAALGQT